MMKNYLFLIFATVAFTANAQVLNPSFENWNTRQNQIQVSGTFQGAISYSINDPQFTYNEVVDWSSLNQLTPTESLKDLATNSLSYEQVKDTTDFVEGTLGLFLETRAVEITAQTGLGPFAVDNNAPGLIVSGNYTLDVAQFADELLNGSGLNSLNPYVINGTGQAIDFRPANLYGSYKYAGANGDSAVIISGVIKDREMIAYTIKRLPNASSWTNFELEYNYLNCLLPDTIVTLILSSNLTANFDEFGAFSVSDNYTGENGSKLFVDDLTMDTLDLNVFPPIAANDSSVILDFELATKMVTNNDDFCGAAAQLPTVYIDGAGGATTVDATGEFEYTPNLGFSGTDEVTYSICNFANLCDTAIWYVTVNPVPTCIAVDDNRSLNENSSSVFDPLANDGDCGGTPDIFTLPFNGVADVESNGFISYSPVTGFVGQDSLIYTVCSSVVNTQCDTAIIRYTVLPITSVRELPVGSITLAPNPAKDLVQISLDNANNITTKITVFNLLGKIVETNSFNAKITLNLKDYTTGIYLIQLENRIGKATRKLVVSK